MLTPPAPSAPVETFLRHLAVEERLLGAAIEKGEEVYAALRRSDLAAVHALGADQERIAAGLRSAAADRAAAAADLLPSPVPDPVTLTLLADRLPGPDGAAVRAARERLAALAADMKRIQTRNANLLGHLRSFIRDVLADFIPDEPPTRYGPSGQWLPPAPNQPLLRRGTTSS